MLRTIAAFLLSLGLATAALAQTNMPIGVGGVAATPVVSTVAEGSHILKASPGALIGLYVVGGASAGYIMIFNQKTVPADGAVTPADCIPIAANSFQYINYAPAPPEYFSSGIVAVYSSTGCFTKTISSGAYFHALVQ